MENKSLDPAIMNLKNGQLVVARWGRAGREKVKWNEWQQVSLFVQLFRGEPCVIALSPPPESPVYWAEYDPRRSGATVKDGIISMQTEDYYLQIKIPEEVKICE